MAFVPWHLLAINFDISWTLIFSLLNKKHYHDRDLPYTTQATQGKSVAAKEGVVAAKEGVDVAAKEGVYVAPNPQFQVQSDSDDFKVMIT